jgi:peptidoglycan/LPS O-acetylase OafA/YrhL
MRDMPEPVERDQRYLAGLDGLRALAVAAVVAYHLGYGWAQGGLLGVGVFFTLSGYLITDILVGQFTATGRIRLGEFWMRRARRLLPALLVMLAVVGVWVNGFGRSFLPGFRGDVAASALYVSNWWYIGQHASYYARFGPPGPLDHLWSLAVEEQFYLVWPWIVLLLVWRLRRWIGPFSVATGPLGWPTRKQLAGLTLSLAVLSVLLMARFYHPGYDPTRVYEGTDTRAFGLLIGAALAMVLPMRTAWAPHARRRLADLGGVAGLLVIGVLVWRTSQYSAFMFRGGLVLLSVATALVVAAAVLPGSRMGLALGCRPLRWLGVRSYGIYLWHYPVIVLTAGAGGGGGPVSAWRALAVVAGTVTAAALSWRFVEEPVRRGRTVRARHAKPPAWLNGRLLGSLGSLGSPVAVGGLCLLTATGLAAGVTSVTSRLASGTIPAAAQLAGGGRPVPVSGTMIRQSAVDAGPVVSRGGGDRAGGAASSGTVRPGLRAAGASGPAALPGAQLADISGAGAAVASAAFVPALPTPPPQTSCRAVVHIGDSTSDGLVSAAYLPDPRLRITAQYTRVGIRRSVMDIVGGTSVVETLPGTLNALDMASQAVHAGYRGCWVIALGTNDTADVYVGSNVGRVQRVEEMMKVIGGQPVLWVAVKSLVSAGPYSELDMRLWNQALAQVAPRYPNMRIYDWPAVVQRRWFISDGIHYTSAGYAARGRLIADALAAAFPAS